MFHVLGCITQQHDLRLVAVAFLLCAFSCYTTVRLLARARIAVGRSHNIWVCGAGAAFGTGVWATHFIAMLAYQTAVPIGFNITGTLLSITFAIAVSGVGFWVAFQPRRAALGGAIVGSAVCLMHYVGMLALQGARLRWDLEYVTASVLMGVLIGALALFVGTTSFRSWGRIKVTSLLTLCVCAVHFTGMSAATLVPVAATDGAIVAPGILAIAVAAVTLLVVSLGLGAALLDRHFRQRRSAEEIRLRAHIVELEDTKRELNRALQEASAASAAKSAFLAGMSHELRTPLNAIIGFSELMIAELFGPLGDIRYAGYSADINKSGTHLLAVINDVLDLTKLDAGKSDLFESKASVRDIVCDACSMVQVQAERAHIALRCEIEHHLPDIYADARRVRQIVVNLLSNAVKFTPKGAVTVAAFMSDGAVCLEVRDTGIGIAEADLARALEAFGQIDNRLSRKYEGTGLGLPLTKHLVELHGGSLIITSTVSVGTTVLVKFPASRTIPAAIAA